MASPAVRLLITALVTIVVVAFVATASLIIVRHAVVSALSVVDERVSVVGVTGGPGAILLTGVVFPSRGVLADSVWVLLNGAPFGLGATEVVITGATVRPVEQPDGGRDPGSRGGDRPSVSILEGTLITGDQESDLFARYDDGVILFSLAGRWGGAWGVRWDNDSLAVVFSNCSGLPGIPELPGIAEGSHVSGTANGRQSGMDADIRGAVTSVNGQPVMVGFSIVIEHGRPRFEIVIDFDKVAPQVSGFLQDASNGAVIGALPEGVLTMATTDGDTLSFTFEVAFPGLRIAHPSVAADTIPFPVAGSGRGLIVPESGVFTVDSGRIMLGEAICNYELSGAWGGRRYIGIRAYNDSMPGAALSSAIPGEMLGRLRGLRLSGSLAFDISLFLDWDRPDSSDVSIEICADRLCVDHCPVGMEGLSSGRGSTVLMRDSWGNSRRIGLDTQSCPGFAGIGSFPPWLEPLICAAEDGTFRSHNGFSEFHLRNSIRADLSQGRFARGGSTLSMQLVKNLFLNREKTLARKLQEVFLTWRMESRLSKDRILELYVNVVEMGPNVFGFSEAASYYFATSVEELSVREAAFLVSILPGPRLYHRYAVSGNVPEYWNSYLDRLIHAAGARTGLDGSAMAAGLGETLVFDGRVSSY